MSGRSASVSAGKSYSGSGVFVDAELQASRAYAAVVTQPRLR